MDTLNDWDADGWFAWDAAGREVRFVKGQPGLDCTSPPAVGDEDGDTTGLCLESPCYISMSQEHLLEELTPFSLTRMSFIKDRTFGLVLVCVCDSWGKTMLAVFYMVGFFLLYWLLLCFCFWLSFLTSVSLTPWCRYTLFTDSLSLTPNPRTHLLLSANLWGRIFLDLIENRVFLASCLEQNMWRATEQIIVQRASMKRAKVCWWHWWQWVGLKCLVLFSAYLYVTLSFVLVSTSKYWVINNPVLRIPLSSASPAL